MPTKTRVQTLDINSYARKHTYIYMLRLNGSVMQYVLINKLYFLSIT